MDSHSGDEALGPARGERFGRYLILDELGAGVMGRLVAAYDTLLDRKVALRFVAGSSGEAGAGALAGAAAMARLRHPNVVTVHDVGVHAGVPYLSMELVAGVNLAEWKRQAPRDHRQIAQVLAAAARGLAAAHAAGIFHGDVNPRTVLVAGARVLVTDLGLSAGATFVSPEQARGEVVGAHTDVFGLCATLYEMLHGGPPFQRETSRVPAHLHRLALRGLEPDPTRRPDMNAVIAALLADPAARRRKAVFGVLAAAVLAVAFWVGAEIAPQAEARCLAGAQVMQGVWSEDRRSELERRYLGTGAAESWPVLRRRLDDHVNGWRAAYAETCAARHGTGVHSDGVFDLRMQCLQRQRDAIQLFVSALASATAPQLVRATAASLPGTDECRISSPPGVKPPPNDPQALAQIAAVEQLVARSLTQQNLGDYGNAAARADEAVAAARKLGYEPLLAAALVQQGTVAKLSAAGGAGAGGGLQDAGRALEEAYAVAELGRADRQRLVAARELVAVQIQLANYTAAYRWTQLGEALLSRLGHPPDEGSILAGYRGFLDLYNDRIDDAVRAARRSVELARKVTPTDHRRLAAAEGTLCATQGGAEQVACARRALALALIAFGPQHPELGKYYNNVAIPLSRQANTHAEACEMMRKGLATQGKQLEPSNPTATRAFLNLADCLREDGRFAEARRMYEQALALDLSAFDRARAREEYGILLRDHVDLKAGVRQLRASLAAYTAIGGASGYDACRLRVTLAVGLLDGGQLEHGLAVLDEGIKVARQPGLENRNFPNLHGFRALALLRQRRVQAAVVAAESAVRLASKLSAPEVEGVARHASAMVQLALGRTEQALADLERGLTALTQAGPFEFPAIRADLQLALARTLARERAPSRACTLAREALATYRSFVHRRTQRAEAELWLQQRCPADV